ncbi:MAG: hypothetical protein ACRYFK_10395 [Janthinobacterium lividum]
MRKCTLACLVASSTLGHRAAAQARPPARPITLDTVAVTGQVRQLTLLPPGEKTTRFSGLPLPPGRRVAVRFQPPGAGHEYDIRSVTLHFSNLFNASSTGSLLVQLARADSAGAPTSHSLLPAAYVLTARQVRRARHGALTLALQGQLPLPPQGIFVVLTGAPAPGEAFVADTFKLEKHGGEQRRVAYVQVRSQASGTIRLVSAADFINLPTVVTTEQPVTWSFWQRDQLWHRSLLSVPQVPHYRPHNYWVELGVTEL